MKIKGLAMNDVPKPRESEFYSIEKTSGFGRHPDFQADAYGALRATSGRILRCIFAMASAKSPALCKVNTVPWQVFVK